jgi:proteasome alpha subunit
MSVFAKPGAYDYNATVFSPDGRLFQVEYAMELVNRGATVLGVKCTEGVVLCSEENMEELEKNEESWKIFKLADHIATAIVGLSSDARVLIGKARIDAQSNKLTYDEAIDIEALASHICDLQQIYTQNAGGRPFGAALLIGGVDKTGAHLFMTHPIGTFRAFKATALGEGKDTVLAILKDEYRENLTLDDTIKLAVKCMLKAIAAKQANPRIKIAVVPTSTMKMDMLSEEAVQNRIKEATIV